MVTKVTTVVNPTGLHARPASVFSRAAGEHESKIWVRNVTKDKELADAKNVLSVMAQGIACGNEVEISAEGVDDQQAVAELVTLMEGGFGE